ncbi:cytochrome c [Desulfonema ishimotonii]|uniref:Cytochrome c n=1 Tax=Desulfonema ishimotonii TaxID=45657 RepID=A0A401FY72_9BACT|nr:cytochrome c3 family protein [Desulfonema ishimotonii]GBC61952.1 cytochrome c [Desulfonema ishimotonii]
MTSNKELKLAYGIAIVLLVVGVLSYTAFSAKKPDQPLRLVFTGAAGSVMFDHKTHVADYGLACTDCHHHPSEPEEEAAVQSCSACHDLPKDGSLPASCLDCHEADEVSLEGTPGKTDAFHAQCIGCHKEGEAGPIECAKCHG